jgi:hypothetical protein
MGGQRTGIRNPGDGPGQPPKLTRPVLEKVLRARECAMSVEEACRAGGFTWSTHANYMKRGEEDAAAGVNSIYAEYFERIPLAAAAGKLKRLHVAMQVIKNPKSKADAVARARLALAYEQMVEGAKESQARRRALKQAAGSGSAPPGQGQEEQKSVPVELSRLSADEFTRYQQLSGRARASFTALGLEEVRELQLLLLKAQGLDVGQEPAPPAPMGGSGGPDSPGEPGAPPAQ